MRISFIDHVLVNIKINNFFNFFFVSILQKFPMIFIEIKLHKSLFDEEIFYI